MLLKKAAIIFIFSFVLTWKEVLSLSEVLGASRHVPCYGFSNLQNANPFSTSIGSISLGSFVLHCCRVEHKNSYLNALAFSVQTAWCTKARTKLQHQHRAQQSLLLSFFIRPREGELRAGVANTREHGHTWTHACLTYWYYVLDAHV